MTTEVATTDSTEQGRKLALLRAIGLDRASPDQRELALNIAQRYELDLLMKHLVLIDGRPYITRDGLLHVAHRAGQLDGIVTSEPAIVDGFWRATASVYRKDMSHPFTYTGRYPTSGGNQKFAPEMAVKVAEVMALRRAFDVAAPTAEERWDADVSAEPAAPAPTLAERAAAMAARNADPARPEPSGEPTGEPSAPQLPAAVQEAPAEPVAERDVAGGAPGEVAPPAPIGRLAFMAWLKEAGWTQQGALRYSTVLFPDVPPKDLTDAQRGELLAYLRRGQAEIDALA